MKTKILLLIATAMIFAMPLLANTTDSDTIWTRSLRPGYIKGCAFTLTGDSIVAISGQSGGDSLYILETATGNVLKRIGIRPWVYSFKGLTHFNTKSWIAIHISVDFGGMYIYDYINDSIINDKFGFMGKTIAITKNDDYLFVQNLNSTPNNISIYDVNNWKSIDSISSGFGVAHSLAISPDDKYLAIGTGKSKIVNPDPENPDYEEERMFDKIVIFNLETKEIIKEIEGTFGTEGMIRDMKFSPDGKYLGVAKLDGSVRVYEMENFELYRKFIVYGYSADSGPWIVTFSNDSKYILAGMYCPSDYTTKVFDIENYKLYKIVNDASCYSLLLTKDNYLLTAGANISLLGPNWITSVNEIITRKNDTTNIIINKSIKSTIEYENIDIIKNYYLYNSYGDKVEFSKNIILFDKTIKIDFKSIQNGVYFLVINEDKIVKILVTE